MLHQMQLRLSPSVTVFTYRAGEEIAIARPGALQTYESNRRHSAPCTSGSTHNAAPTSARTRSR